MKGSIMRNRWFAGFLGMGTCALLLGCGAGPADTDGSQSGSAEAAHDHATEHDHSAQGPHGGHVIVLGEEEYHAELTHDEATHTVTIYLLDSTGKKPVSSEQGSITVHVFKDGEFADYPLEATGDDGAFSTIDEQLCDLLLHAEEVKGRLHVTIAGKEYVGTIEHAAHDHDDHADHDHDHGTEHAEHDDHDHGG
jgi:hypothetical protein